jgi:bud site selection protein 31
VESASHEGKRKTESLWPVFRIAHQRSRYVYTMYYKRGEVSREVYEYCLREGHADEALIAKWKKPGYEHLCCLSCVAAANHNFGGVCICRVPRKDLDAGKVFECPHCGCRGCASGDASAEALIPAAAAARLDAAPPLWGAFGPAAGGARPPGAARTTACSSWRHSRSSA